MKVVEFIGMPRTGKTTQVQKLVRYLEDKGLSSEVITDRDFIDKVKIPIEQTFLYNKEFFALMREEAERKVATKPDFLIYDRGFYDQLVWSTDDVLLGNSTQVQKEEFDKEFDSYREENAALIHLVAPKLVREQRHAESQEVTQIDDVVLADDFLAKLEESYRLVTEKVFSKCPNYLEIESTQEAEKTFREVLDFLSEKGLTIV